MSEQPEIQTEGTNPDGGQGVASILDQGLRDTAGSPEDADQLGGEPIKQPEQPIEEAEELFGELLLEDEKKLPFKSQKDLEAFLEKNMGLFEKSGHFLRQSDYTKKTQALREQQEQFDAEKRKADQLWGDVKPDENSMSAFSSLWGVFQHGTQELRQAINAFMQDTILLANGQAPVGPLAQGTHEGDSITSPETIRLRRELADLKREVALGRRSSEEREEQQTRERAERDWQSWRKAKVDSGFDLKQELEQAMVPYLMGMANSNLDSNSKLDRAFKLACDELGIDGKQAVKEAFASADRAKRRTPVAPGSKTPASAEPEPKDLKGILEHGLRQMA